MTYKVFCQHIELETLEHPTMEGKELVSQWYCHSEAIDNYIDECPEDCPYFGQKR